MDFHIKQLPLHCRVCGQRLMTRKHKKEIHECKAFAADLQTAFSINTNTDNAQVYSDLNTSAIAVTIQCRGLSVPG